MEHVGGPSSKRMAWYDEVASSSNNNGSEGDLDLDRWDYLTQTYDRADFFREDASHLIVEQQSTSSLQCARNQASSSDTAMIKGASLLESRGVSSSTSASHFRYANDNDASVHMPVASMGYTTNQASQDGGCEPNEHTFPYTTQSQLAEYMARQQLRHSLEQEGLVSIAGDMQLAPLPSTNVPPANLSRYLQKPPHEKGSFDSSCGMDQLCHPPLPTAPNATFRIADDVLSPPRVSDLLKLPMHASPENCSSRVAKGISSLLPAPDSFVHQDTLSGYAFRSAQAATLQTTTPALGVATRDATLLPYPPIFVNSEACATRPALPLSLPSLPPPSLSGQPNVGQSRPVVAAASAAPMIPPLTAYNYFYRNERDTIVNGMQYTTDPIPPSEMDFSAGKMQQLLHHHWTVDPFKKKRQHKRTHGIIDFQTLSREIAKRWKRLPEHGRAFYRQVANVDQERYESYLATMRQGANHVALANHTTETSSVVTAVKPPAPV